MKKFGTVNDGLFYKIKVN